MSMPPTWRWFDRVGGVLLAAVMVPGVLLGAYYGWARLFPASRWYDLSSVHVPDGVVGEIVTVVPIRTVHRPFWGSYVTTLREAQTMRAVCSGGSEVRYDPRAGLPDPVTLDWWTAGAEPPCQEALGSGEFVLTTCVRVDLIYFPDREVCAGSNLFTIRPRKDT